MKKSLSVLMLGMLLVQQLPLSVAFAKSEPAPTETATLSETSATLETPENASSETSATPKTPENIASEGSATPKTSENIASEGSATLETPENIASEGSATLETPENIASEGSATPETSIQPSAEDSALTEEPAPMMRSPAPMMRSPASMTEFKEIRYFDKTNPADGIIMMDRNLGATSDDITSPDSYGYYYQWGNNYGFWNGTAHATNEDGTQEFITGTTLVDASAYGPNNPYSNKTFIIDYEGTSDRASSSNDNLRGGAEDGKNNNYGREVTNPTDRQGPCPAGYHVPSQGEWNKLLQLFLKNEGKIRGLKSGYLEDYNFQDNGFMKTFKLPPAQGRDTENGLPFSVNGYFEDEVGFYWSSSPDLDNSFNSLPDGARSFDSYYNHNNSGLIRVTANNPGGHRVLGLPVRCFKDSYTPPQNFHLVFTGDAIAIPALEVYEGMTGAVPPAPSRDGYEFKGWFTGEDYAQEFNFDEPFTKDRTAYAKWDVTPEKLTELKATAKAEIEALANLSPEEKADFKNQVDTATDEAGITQAVNAAKAKDAANLENKKTPAKSEGGYSGGGGSSRIYSQTTATTTTINDTPLANNKAEHSAVPEELATLPSTITPSSSSTTASSISSTNKIIRGQLAQLLVFLDNAGIPLKKPKTNSGCQFSDVAPHQRVATQAVCQRGLMGIDDKTKLPLAKFDPNQTLSYADFATVLSRMLFAYQYDGNGFYYQSHINALQELNILAITNPHEKISSHTVVSLLASLAKPFLGK